MRLLTSVFRIRNFIYLFLFWPFIPSDMLSAQPMSRTEFHNEVNSTYSELTFAGVDLAVNGVQLRPIHFGYAFAFLERSTSKRWICLNEIKLFERYKLEYETINKRKVADSLDQFKKLKSSIIDEVRGLIAHEWSHHFLGHTFSNISRINERNADFITGRILYEYFYNKEPNEKLDSAQLRRSWAVTHLYPEQKTGSYHLPRDARTLLIQKGFTMGWLFQNHRAIIRDDSIKSHINEAELARRIDNLQARFDSAVIDLKKKQLLLLNQHIDTLYQNLDPLKYVKSYDKDTLTIRPQNPLEDSVSNNNLSNQINLLISNSLNNINKEVSECRIQLEKMVEKEKKTSKCKQLKVTRSDQYEPLYNLFYIQKMQKTASFQDSELRQSVLKEFENTRPKAEMEGTEQSYRLKGGIVFKVNICSRSVRMEQSQRSRTGKIHSTDQEDEGLGLIYKFKFDENTYFLDSNYHLWTTTIGSPLIKNRLFLQPSTK